MPLLKAALEVFHALPCGTGGIVLPVQRITLFHAFSATCKRAGIMDFHFHDLRHEALSRVAERESFRCWIGIEVDDALEIAEQLKFRCGRIVRLAAMPAANQTSAGKQWQLPDVRYPEP